MKQQPTWKEVLLFLVLAAAMTGIMGLLVVWRAGAL